MNAFLRLMLILGGLLFWLPTTSAHGPVGEKAWREMSPDEREEMRQQMREEWKRLSPEEREERKKAYKDYKANRGQEDSERHGRGSGPRPERQSLSPEEKEQFKVMLYERHSRSKTCPESLPPSGAPPKKAP